MVIKALKRVPIAKTCSADPAGERSRQAPFRAGMGQLPEERQVGPAAEDVGGDQGGGGTAGGNRPQGLPTLPRSRRTRARAPAAPMRLSFITSSMRLGSRLAARASKTSAQPSSWRPPVTRAAAARASTDGTGSGQRKYAPQWTAAASNPTSRPTMGK